MLFFDVILVSFFGKHGRVLERFLCFFEKITEISWTVFGEVHMLWGFKGVLPRCQRGSCWAAACKPADSQPKVIRQPSPDSSQHPDRQSPASQVPASQPTASRASKQAASQPAYPARSWLPDPGHQLSNRGNQTLITRSQTGNQILHSMFWRAAEKK